MTQINGQSLTDFDGYFRIKSLYDLNQYLRELRSLHAQINDKTFNNQLLRYHNNLLFESAFVRQMVSKLFNLGVFEYQNWSTRKTNLGGSQEESKKEKYPLEFTKISELVEFITSKIDFYKKESKQDETICSEKKKEKEIDNKIRSFYYHKNLANISFFVKSNRDNLLFFSLQQNPQIEILLNQILEKFKNTNEYANIESMINYCKSNNYRQINSVLNLVISKKYLITDLTSVLQTEELINNLRGQTECISCEVLVNSFKNYPNMQADIRKFFGSRHIIPISELLRRFDFEVQSYNRQNPNININDLRLQQVDSRKLIGKLEAERTMQNTDSTQTLSELQAILTEVKGVQSEYDQRQKSISEKKARREFLIDNLQKSDEDLLRTFIYGYEDEIKELEKQIDEISESSKKDKKKIVSSYAHKLSNIYLEVISKFFQQKMYINNSIYECGDGKKTPEEIEQHTVELDEIKDKFDALLETIRTKVANNGIISIGEVLNNTPTSVNMQNDQTDIQQNGIGKIKLFFRKPILFRKLRICRHSIIFGNLFAKFDKVFDNLLTSLENGRTENDTNQLEQSERVDISDILSGFQAFTESDLKQDEPEKIRR